MRRPARKPIPLRVLRICERRQGGKCACGCGMQLEDQTVNNDHRPPLIEREVNADGTDYIPPQHDPAYIEILIKGHHDTRTFGSGGTRRIETRSGDIGRHAHNKSMKQKHDAHVAIMKAKQGV